jgi:hypothetical protein
MSGALRRLLQRFARSVQVRMMRSHEIGKVEGIALIDLDHYTPYFKGTITGALELIKNTDSRRFARVQRYIKFIMNCAVAHGGALYRYDTKTCEVEFICPKSDWEVQCYTACYACALVHEATHGRIRDCGVRYTPEWRARIERLCVKEETRFLRRLQIHPRIVQWLNSAQEFNPANWKLAWESNAWQTLVATLRRTSQRDREQKRQAREE